MESLTLTRARFISETQFMDIDGDGIHPHPFLIAEILFSEQPTDGDTLTLGESLFTFKDAASNPGDIQIGVHLGASIDYARDVINSANLVHKTARGENLIRLYIADTVGIALSATGRAMAVTNFAACGGV